MRVFIGIKINDRIIKRIQAIHTAVIAKEGELQGVKWVEGENIHLTLAFLGEIDDQSAADICSRVTMICQRHREFVLKFSGAGVFGDPARVLWVGLKDVPAELVDIYEYIGAMCDEFGIGRDCREFDPHVTICRVKTRKSGHKLIDFVKDQQFGDFGEQVIDSIYVCSSQLTETGPVYVCLAKCRLGQA